LFENCVFSRRIIVNTKKISLRFYDKRWIKAILNDVKAFAPASVYTLIMGCHGMEATVYE
jgi:hypothetical protein